MVFIIDAHYQFVTSQLCVFQTKRRSEDNLKPAHTDIWRVVLESSGPTDFFFYCGDRTFFVFLFYCVFLLANLISTVFWFLFLSGAPVGWALTTNHSHIRVCQRVDKAWIFTLTLVCAKLEPHPPGTHHIRKQTPQMFSSRVNQVCFSVKITTWSVSVPIMAFKLVCGAHAKLLADVDLSHSVHMHKGFSVSF